MASNIEIEANTIDNAELYKITPKKIKEETKRVDTTKYRPLRQNQINDNIIKGLLEPKQLSIFDGSATTQLDPKKKQEFTLTIENFEDLEKVLSNELYNSHKANQSAGKLLDSFLIKMTEQGFTSTTATIPLKEYAELTGKKDLKELRARTKADLQVLKRVKFSSTPKRKSKNNQDYIDIYLFGGTEGIINGNIVFKFNENFFQIFSQQRHFLYIPLEVLQSNERKNPHTYLLYKKIVSHKRMNLGKKNENTIKVKTLYDYCVTLPRYEDVMSTDKHIDQRIIQPFERDLDIIKEFSWHYETKEPPTNFEEWKNTNIVITWHNTLPDTTTILDGRNKHNKKKK